MAKKTLYVARGNTYNVYVTPHGQKGQGSRPKKVTTITVPERLSRKVRVERLKVAPGIRRAERRK